MRQELLYHLACCVFQPPRRRMQLFEPCDSSVEVSFVEYLAAAEHVTFHRHNRDHPPLGVEPLLRCLTRRVGDHCSEVVQAMYSLDRVGELSREVPRGIEQRGHFT